MKITTLLRLGDLCCHGYDNKHSVKVMRCSRLSIKTIFLFTLKNAHRARLRFKPWCKSIKFKATGADDSPEHYALCSNCSSCNTTLIYSWKQEKYNSVQHFVDPSIHPELVPTGTLSLCNNANLTSSFASVIMKRSARGLCHVHETYVVPGTTDSVHFFLEHRSLSPPYFKNLSHLFSLSDSQSSIQV